MKVRGVLGGSMLGTTFFQASTNAESAVGFAGRSVEKDRALPAERMGRAKREVARRNMVGERCLVTRGPQGRRERYSEGARNRG